MAVRLAFLVLDHPGYQQAPLKVGQRPLILAHQGQNLAAIQHDVDHSGMIQRMFGIDHSGMFDCIVNYLSNDKDINSTDKYQDK
jgi:hypothetical protein